MPGMGSCSARPTTGLRRRVCSVSNPRRRGWWRGRVASALVSWASTSKTCGTWLCDLTSRRCSGYGGIGEGRGYRGNYRRRLGVGAGSGARLQVGGQGTGEDHSDRCSRPGRISPCAPDGLEAPRRSDTRLPTPLPRSRLQQQHQQWHRAPFDVSALACVDPRQSRDTGSAGTNQRKPSSCR